MKVKTHDFARELLKKSDSTVRGWVFRRLVIIWDTKRPSTDKKEG